MTQQQERSTDAVPVEVLTDEELAILAGPDGMVVSPFAASAGDTGSELVRRTAYRGLLARGILDPPTVEAQSAALARGDGRVELEVREDVRSVVLLREAARVVVAVARTTAAGQDFWYAHVVDDVVLLEEVSSDGMHRFALGHADQLPAFAEAAAVHPDCGDAAGEPAPLAADPDDPTPPDAVIEALGAALLRSDVVVRFAGDAEPVLLGLFTGPGGAWAVSVRGGSGEPPVAVPTTARDVRERVRDMVRDGQAQVTIRGL